MTRTPDGRGRERRTGTILPSVLSAREHGCPPPRPDRLPPRRGGGSSPYSYALSTGGPRALAAAACLSVVCALALPTTAQAQEIALVSNIGQGHSSIQNVTPPGYALGTIELGERRIAQRFTTGPNTAGYTLQSVVLNLLDKSGAEPERVQVAIHEESSGNPGTLLAVLDNPADPIGDNTGTAGNRTFSAPNPLSLDANTRYWVVVSNISTANAKFDISLTNSDNETTAHGFTIRDSRHQGTPGSWSEDALTVVKMEVRGTVVIPPLDVTLHLSDEDGSVLENAGWVTVTATASPASPVPFTVTVSADPVAPATEDDFRLSSNLVLSFAANATESTGTVRIGPIDDDNPEPDDVVRVSGAVSNATIPDPDDVTLTIVNEDAEAFDVAVSAPTAVDEDAGTATVTVTLTTRRNSAPVIDVELYYYWRQETATRGEDYRPPPGEVFVSNVLFTTVPTSAFSPNAAGTAWEAERTFTIGIVDDQEAEADEAIVFYVSTRASNSPNHTITIRDDDTPVMRNVPLVSGPGSDGVWSIGERVELDVRYTLPVVVEQPEECWSYNADGTCKPPGPFVAVVFRSDARPGYGEGLGVALVPYVSGSGTATLRFAYTVGAAEAGARGVVVVDGKVLLRGATIRPRGGGDDVEPEFTRTRVMQVNVRKPGGSAWTAGDMVRVNVRFAGPAQYTPDTPFDERPNWDKVEVNDRGGTPTIRLLLGDPDRRGLTRTARYDRGSGSNTLRFEYEVTAGDGQVTAVEAEANSLALNGGTIRNELGYDAELGHLSAVGYGSLALLVRDTAAALEGETLKFTMELVRASEAPVTVDYETADGTATAGEDYTAERGTVRFAPGGTRKTVEVAVLRDEETEDAETVVLRLSNARSEGSEEPVEVTDPEAEGTIEDVAPAAELTAEFRDMPETHDGESAFTFRVAPSPSGSRSVQTCGPLAPRPLSAPLRPPLSCSYGDASCGPGPRPCTLSSRSPRAAAELVPRTASVARGSKVSLGRLLQDQIVQRQICHRPLQPLVLLLELLQPLRLARLHPSVLPSPPVVRLLTHAQLPAHLLDPLPVRYPDFGLPQGVDDLSRRHVLACCHVDLLLVPTGPNPNTGPGLVSGG